MNINLLSLFCRIFLDGTLKQEEHFIYSFFFPFIYVPNIFYNKLHFLYLIILVIQKIQLILTNSIHLL